MSAPSSMAPISRRILASLLVASLLPVVLISSYHQLFTRKALLDYEYNLLSITSDGAAREALALLDLAAGRARALSSPLRSPGPEGVTTDFVRSLPELAMAEEVFARVRLYDPLGRALYASDGASLDSLPPPAGIRRALQGEASQLPPHLILGATNLFVSFYAPITAWPGGKPYAFSADFSLEHLRGALERASLGGGGFFVLLDERGNILAHPDAARLLTKFDPVQPVRPWARRGVYELRAQSPLAFVSVEIPAERTYSSGSWTLLGFKRYEEMLVLPRREMRLYAAFAGVSLLAILVMGLLVSRKIARPLIRAAEAAQHVTQGDLEAVIPEAGPREIRQLAVAFNQMVQELRQHRNRMENMVQQRTLKLRESQRQLEQLTAHLRATYESIVDGILIMEWPSGKVVAANHHFASLFGLDSASLTGKTPLELGNLVRGLFVEPREDAFRWEYYQKHSEETAMEEWEMREPARMTLAVYTGPVAGAHGQVFARLWMFRDFSKQRLLEAELLQAQKMEAIGRLAGGVAHDFNNLLTGILGNLTMAEMEVKEGGDSAQFILLARQAAKRAAELVQQLLGFSRRSRLNLTRTCLNSIAREVQDLLKHTVDPRVELASELQEDLWSVQADATQLQQVLMNLCVNAVDAMPEGGRLTLRTRNVEVSKEESLQWADAHAGEYVLLLVEDQGQGMTLEVQNHMFEPFFTTKGPGKGTGLGLAMSYGIVKQHGGWIVCQSELNKGTTFHIYLPRTIKAAEAETAVQPQAPVTGGQERILVVDDEPAVRGVVMIVLRKYGYQVFSAEDGEEAVNLFPQMKDQIDLVLLDLTMPKLSGRDTFLRLREMRPDIPIVLSSGYSLEIDSFAQDVGSKPNGFVHKPFDVSDLARSVRSVLDSVKKHEPPPS